MRSLGLIFALMVAVGVAAAFAVLHFEQASRAMGQIVQPGPLSPSHAFLGDRCESCHEPVAGVTASNCTECHASAERLLGRQPTAFHAGIAECSGCHIEHQSATIRPVVMDHVELAAVGGRMLARSHLSDAVSAGALSSMEAWMHVRIAGQRDASAAADVLDCAGCHSTKDRHVGLFGKECAQCHDLTTWSITTFRHPSARSTDCAQCHQPPPSHSMMHFTMMSRTIAAQPTARVDQCFACHQTTSWNDIRNVGWLDHH